jgi:ADP-heptose:LPS heptosyltransferase
MTVCSPPLAGLISGARLLVCNDTGVSHIATAVATPSVIISWGADPARFAPLACQHHRVLYHPTACRPCAHDRCPFARPCAHRVSVAAVVNEARRLLAVELPRAA